MARPLAKAAPPAGMNDAAQAAVLVAVITTIGSIAVTVITTFAHRRTREELRTNTSKTDQVLHEVKNDHGTNLRDDLDHLRDSVAAALDRIEAAQGKLGGYVGQIQHQLRTYRHEQRDHDAASALLVHQLVQRDEELAAEIRRHHPEEGKDSGNEEAQAGGDEGRRQDHRR